jgi:hypothetical protein
MESAPWIIPAGKMKMRKAHHVPRCYGGQSSCPAQSSPSPRRSGTFSICPYPRPPHERKLDQCRTAAAGVFQQ